MRICVGALLVSRGRILLVHRRTDREWYPNVWDIPGGHVGEETHGEALARELSEELGVQIMAPTDPPFRLLEGDGYRMGVWILTAWTGTPVNKAAEEHDEIRWVTISELDDLLLADPSYRELFRLVLPSVGSAAF